eukprot:1436050-Pyramimonas_sp.AAC.1
MGWWGHAKRKEFLGMGLRCIPVPTPPDVPSMWRNACGAGKECPAFCAAHRARPGHPRCGSQVPLVPLERHVSRGCHVLLPQ